jgi:hypothetical protein
MEKIVENIFTDNEVNNYGYNNHGIKLRNEKIIVSSIGHDDPGLAFLRFVEVRLLRYLATSLRLSW